MITADVRLCTVLTAVTFVASAPAADAVRLAGENRRTAQRFAEAASLEAAGRWPAAIDAYLSLLDDAGADLAAADSAGVRWLPARWIIHRRIARSPQLLEVFRERMDGPARRLLEAGVAARDAGALERLAESMFCARPIERALDMLGDMACERGDWAAARRYWSYLAPDHRPDALVYPEPAGGPALPRAKIIVARLLAGEGVADDMARFQRVHPTATGHLAGRDGKLIDLLRDLARSGDLRSPGGSDLKRRAFGRLSFPNFDSAEPFPPISLPDAPSEAPIRFVQRTPAGPRALAFLPSIVAGHALVADARRISAFDLASGQQSSQFDVRSAGVSIPSLDARLPSHTDVRYALTVAGDRVYARFGQVRMRPDRADADSAIVALRFRPGNAEQWQLLWTLPAIPPERNALPIFEGTPLLVDGRLIVAATRIDGNRAITSVSCYEPADAAPQLIWQREILDAPADSAERTWHVSLTRSDRQVVLGPLAGTIVSLDAATGQPAWALRIHPSKSANAEMPPRTGHDCLATNGVVHATLADPGRVVAIDAIEGTPLWESDPLDARHLLGISNGKLFVQTGGLTSGLLALDQTNGRPVPNWGYSVFGADAAAPFGNGVLVGDRICWATRSAGVMIAHTDGTPEYAPAILRGLPGGNLVFADGFLLVATADRLHVVATISDASAAIPVQSQNDRTRTFGSSHDRGALR